jgi:transcriptional regulator with XRE-family HTH domain
MLTVAKKKPRPKGFDGSKLRELRGKMTLTELAKKAGLSAADISRYERDLVVPSYDVVCRLADALGVRTDDFRESGE